jgi:hypothetical protein
MFGFNDNDGEDMKKKKWQEIHELENRILDKKLEHLHQYQHVGSSLETLKEIETTA